MPVACTHLLRARLSISRAQRPELKPAIPRLLTHGLNLANHFDLNMKPLVLVVTCLSSGNPHGMRRIQTRWSDREIEIIVQDYLDMLRIEEAGGAFNKAERNRTLQARIGRSKGSIEYKHRNTSAVMEQLGLRFIQGYKLAQN